MQTVPASAPGRRSPVRILIVDAHEVSRAACRALLRTEGIDVIADVPGGDEAITHALALRPDVVIIDVTPADGTGLRIAGELAALADPPVIVLTSSADRCRFGSQLDGYRFIAKADICAREIAITVQARQQASPWERPIPLAGSLGPATGDGDTRRSKDMERKPRCNSGQPRDRPGHPGRSGPVSHRLACGAHPVRRS